MLAHQSNCRRGFTLVELLVVVAVIALLIGVLLPALAGARESSRRVASAANLRQLAVYNNLYAEDFQDWFPMVVVARSLTGPEKSSRRLDSTTLAKNQWYYGGYAGFFSLNQKEAYKKSTAAYRRDQMAYWSQGSWMDAPVGKLRPIMDRYIEGTASYGVLQNPADSMDGGENGAAYPALAPQTITSEYDLAWFNVSYMYIAGLKRTDPTLCFLGDETNAIDIGAEPSLSPSGIVNYQGTFRVRYAELKKRGLQSTDNHGEAGGNYAFTDGHVEWITGSKHESTTGSGVMPHDRIFDEINQFLAKRGDSTTQVQTVD